jgi:hypothetical protein
MESRCLNVWLLREREVMLARSLGEPAFLTQHRLRPPMRSAWRADTEICPEPRGDRRTEPKGPLPRAARELRHVPGKGLRAELKRLDHGEVGEELFGEVPHGETVADGERGRLDDLPAFRRQHLGPEQAPAPMLGDELDEAPGVEVGERPRHVIQAQGAVVNLEAQFIRLRRRQAHGRDLRDTTSGTADRSTAASPPIMLIAARVPAAAATYTNCG